VARIIWNHPANPTDYVSTTLGIERWQLRNAIHKIKARSGLGSRDGVIIHDNGEVTDQSGEHVGNIYDEV
jgi:hypothetical protein